MIVRDALRQGAALLAEANVDTPRLDARLLLAHAAGLTQAGLLQDPNRSVDAAAYRALLDRRVAREPVALILGHQEFWSLPFAVSNATLVPRPDTETLIEAALAVLDRAAIRSVLDLGTGTGCLLLAALSELPGAWGVGVDLVPAAASLAQCNARALGLHGRAAFLCGEWATAISGQFDLVLSNPPYISAPDLTSLMPEVKRYEPMSALNGGDDGLEAYRAILPDLRALLSPGGLAVLELGIGQSDAVTALATASGLRQAGLRSDLSGVPRALLLRAA